MKLEVGSPRAFLCEDPRFLARPISMRGHPKLWQLPPQILSRAETCLQLPPQVMHTSVRVSHTSVHTYFGALLRSVKLRSHLKHGGCWCRDSSRPHAACAGTQHMRHTAQLAATPCLPC